MVNEDIRERDPYLTLVDGDKIRVYYGGDYDQFNVQAKGVIENHVEYFKKITPKKKRISVTDDVIALPMFSFMDFDEP